MNYKKIFDKINVNFFKESTEKLREIDKDSILKDLLSKKDKLFSILEKDSAISKVFQETKLLFSMIQDYSKGKYQDVSWTSIAGVVATLLCL